MKERTIQQSAPESELRLLSAKQAIAPLPRAARAPLFESFYIAGFECSDHYLEDGRRLDLLTSTMHDRFARQDYERARDMGISACRDGVSWVRSEPRPGHYDFSHFLPRLRAAEGRQQVIWDLMHFGWPAHIDVFAPDFAEHFARYARAAAEFFREHAEMLPMFTLINEISFLAWAGGDVACMNPFAIGRSNDLKMQFVLATIHGIEAVRDVFPHARFVHPEPVINIIRSPELPMTWRRIDCDNELQYEALDMLSGRAWKRLGGHPKYLDIVGVNFYPNNQFLLDGTTVYRDDPRFKPFSRMLLDVWERYQRPMMIAETGAEGDERAPWLEYVVQECLAAMHRGCELHGLTLYPVVDHPGWVDDRHCPNGLWSYANDHGERAVCAPLAAIIQNSSPALLVQRAATLAACEQRVV